MTPDQSAPPDEVGLCPGCNGHGGCGPLADCGHCGGTGRIRYSSTFTADEDRILRALIETGRPVPYAAVELRKPIPIVYGRCSELGLLSREEPGAFFTLRMRDGRQVDIDDPARTHEGFA